MSPLRHPSRQEDQADLFARRLWEQVALDDARAMARTLLGETEDVPLAVLPFCLADAACCAVEHGATACLEWLGQNMLDLSGVLPQGGNLLHVWAGNDGVMVDVEASEAVLELLLEAGAAPGQPGPGDWSPWLMSSADHRPVALRKMQPFLHRPPTTSSLVPPVLGGCIPPPSMRKLEDYTRHWRTNHRQDPVADACLTMLCYLPPIATTQEARRKDFTEVFEILRPAPGAPTEAFAKKWFEDALARPSWMPDIAWSVMLRPEFRQHLPPDAVDRLAAAFPRTFMDRPGVWLAACRAGLVPADRRKAYGCMLAACLNHMIDYGTATIFIDGRATRTSAAAGLSIIAQWLRPADWANTAAACGMPDAFDEWLKWATRQSQAPQARTTLKAMRHAMQLAASPPRPLRPRLRA